MGVESEVLQFIMDYQRMTDAWFHFCFLFHY